MEDDKTILETYMCGFNNELDVKERISDLSPLLLKAYDLGALHAVVGDDVRSVDYLSDEKILDMIKSSDTNIRYNKARLYSSKIVKAVLDECELNGTFDEELIKMEKQKEANQSLKNLINDFTDSYTQTVAIEFALWMGKKDYTLYDFKLGIWIDSESDKEIATTELYNQFMIEYNIKTN